MIRVLGFMAAFLILSGAVASVQAGVLDEFRGEKQFVLLFTKSRSDAALDRQIDLLSERRPSLDQRDMVVLITTKGRDTAVALGYAAMPLGAGRRLTAEFEPADSGLTVILIAKDGAQLGRWQQVVDPQIMFDLIDDSADAGL
jgi:hypothetical protein